MIKYELIKETKPNGAIVYYIEKNGKNSMPYTVTFDLEHAKRYLSILSKGTKEVIETIEINK